MFNKYYQLIMIMCGDIRDVYWEAKSNNKAKSNNDETKKKLIKRKQPVKLKISIFYLHFY